jgi:flavin reductase (DIM6/NTAB) family NADH-FMN oxidoreductase RutF/DNA-binding GntR family transcriptional regulator
MGHFASGVTVITTMEGDEPRGTTASAVTSLSLEPPMLVACLNRDSQTARAVVASHRFGVNILSEDQADAATAFARSGGDKFGGVATTVGDTGVPLLDDALATLECRVVAAPVGGTHYVFLAEVERAVARDGAPLTYFGGRFGRFSHADDAAVTNHLRALVLARSVEVGETLDVDELAASFPAPRAVVYGALMRLASEGILARGDRGSFVVRAITLEAAEDALIARAAIELGAARRAFGQLTQRDVEICRALVASLDPVGADGRPVELAPWLERAVGLLDHLVSLAGSPSLLGAYRSITIPAVVLSLRSPDLNAGEPRPGSDQELRALVDAYERRDLDAAAELIDERRARLTDVCRKVLSAAGGRL